MLAATALAADPKAESRDALWAAVRAGDEKAIIAALDKGADVNAKNEYGVTALWIAANKGKTEVIELLLARGADPNARDDIWYQTPLSHSLGKVENVKVLLKAGAKDVDAAVLSAVAEGNAPVVQADPRHRQGHAKRRSTRPSSAIGESNKEIREALDEGRGEAAARRAREGPRSVEGARRQLRERERDGAEDRGQGDRPRSTAGLTAAPYKPTGAERLHRPRR